jgi:DnaJ-class molecular chaperone
MEHPPAMAEKLARVRCEAATSGGSLGLEIQPMPDKAHTDFHACLNCVGRGAVPSRLPFRSKPCDQCGGRGVVTPVRRQQLLAKLKAKVRERVDT